MQPPPAPGFIPDHSGALCEQRHATSPGCPPPAEAPALPTAAAICGEIRRRPLVSLGPLLGGSQRLAFRNVVSTHCPHNSTPYITAHNHRKYHMSLRRARSRVGPPTPHVAAGACTYGTLPRAPALHPRLAAAALRTPGPRRLRERIPSPGFFFFNRRGHFASQSRLSPQGSRIVKKVALGPLPGTGRVGARDCVIAVEGGEAGSCRRRIGLVVSCRPRGSRAKCPLGLFCACLLRPFAL